MSNISHDNGCDSKADKPLVSIITVVYNNACCIRSAIESVLSQDYPLIEYVVIDGNSTDGTIEIIQEYRDKISFFLSEPDKGIYDALNKGIAHARGDVVGILHSDDLYYDDSVITDMIQKMSDTDSEISFSDVVIIDSLSGKVIRYYMSSYFNKWLFRTGWMPPHTACFISKSLFDEFGVYSTDYKISADFDFFVRIFFGRKIHWTYLKKVSVIMSHGGLSNSGFSSKKLIAIEIRRSLRKNNVWSLSVFQLLRYLMRLMELVIRPNQVTLLKIYDALK